MKLKQLMSATALAGILASYPAIASAQTATSPTPSTTAQEDDATGESEAIIVTGSRIRSPNEVSNIPTVSITNEDIFQQGQTSLGDVLNDLPGLRSTFGQNNPGAGVGITGLSLLDLRGLGTVRTLVLVNGRRHVASDILNNASSVDVGTIPFDLVERIDVVTGGNSAVYGSDAVAGVVNFVLKQDFEGLQLRGRAAVSETGYGGNQFVSVLAGKNFADGRGNVTVAAEYSHQRQTYASEIPFLRRNDAFATVDVDPTGLPQNSDGFPDQIFFRDIRSSTINRFGMAIIPQQQGLGTCGVGTAPTNGGPNTAGTSFSCNYLFNPDGTLVPQTGTRVGTGPAGTYIGGNGQTGREGELLSVIPFYQRVNVNLLAHYDFSDAFKVFVEAKYARTESIGNQLGPTFLNNTTGSLGNDARIDPRLDNPFLSPTARTTIATQYTAANCGYTLGTSTAAATCSVGNAAAQAARAAAIANGSFRFLFARSLTDAPNREEAFQRQTYRIVGGARGTFFDDWSYEISANYGRFDETTDAKGFVDRQRFLLSLDAGRNPLTGAIQCRSQFDPTAAVGAPNLGGTAAAASKLASDIAACVPYNVFGQTDNSAAVNYFLASPRNRAYLEQFDVTGFVNGNSSRLFSLPGGPISFSLGGEYRIEKSFNNSDGNADTGLDNFVYLGDVNTPPLRVAEGFLELKAPILKDVPFFHELTLSGAGRVSGYNNATGIVYTYNGGVEWSPVRDIRFRANYGRAVRAPNVSESSFPNVPNFANGFIDPCNVNAISLGTANRATNCTNQLSTAQLANLPQAGYSLNVISGSNPNLQAETSDSYLLGTVIQPRWIPGLTISVDYFNIRVSNVIVSLAAQTIVNACYDSANLSSPLCNAFQRNLSASNGPLGELPGQILGNSTVQGPQNFARRIAKGIDFQVDYAHSFSSAVSLNSRFLYTHGLQRSNFENPTIPNTENIILGELGDPVDEFNFSNSLKIKDLTLGADLHLIGRQVTSTYEAFFPNNVGVTGQTGLPTNSDAIEPRFYPTIAYVDLRMGYRIRSQGRRTFDLLLGIDNVTGQNPPYGLTGTGAGSAIYSIRGRNFYAGFTAKF